MDGQIYYPPRSKETNELDTKSNFATVLPPEILSSLDAILVLGGGVPPNPHDPPIYVKYRCRIASDIFRYRQQQFQTASSSSSLSSPSLPRILALSAGTAHLPQLMSKHLRLPVWESTASASYLLKELAVPSEYVFVETTSFDTISNAFFARTSFTDVVGWRNLLIITNEFHIERTKAIFDWIMGAAPSTRSHPSSSSSSSSNNTITGNEHGDDIPSPYRLHYYAAPDIGLTNEALTARQTRERQSTSNVLQNLAPIYPMLPDVWTFITRDHALYNASKLSARSDEGGAGGASALVKDSYGGLGTNTASTSDGGYFLAGDGQEVSFVWGVLGGLVLAWCLAWVRGKVVSGIGRRGHGGRFHKFS